MTLVSEILSNGYRESNVTADAQILTASQTTAALARLQAVLLSCLGADLGYIMEDWNATDTGVIKPNGVPLPTADFATFTVTPNSRLMFNLANAATYKLDPQPQDGQRVSIVDVAGNFATHPLTVNPNGRKFGGAGGNTVLSTNNLAQQWVYRSDVADWVSIDPLDPTDEFPFPADFDDYFSILLAQRLNPRSGRQLDQQSMDRYQAQEMQFVNRYTQSRLRSVPTPGQNNPARSQGSAQ